MSDVATAGMLAPALSFGSHRTTSPFPEILSETAQLLLSEADPETLCQAVFQLLRKPFGIDIYFHYLVSEDETHLELAASGGNARLREVLGSRLEMGSAVCGTVARRGVPIYVRDVRHREDAMTALIREVGVSCYACFPLLIRGRILGTLSFGSTLKTSYTSDEIELFSLVAKQITVATDRRNQSERLRQLERLATAGRMSATLAHEINNPLDSLGHLLYLLHDTVVGKDATELLQQAEEQVAQLTRTVQHTLELFRGGQQSATTLNLSQLARELVAGLHLPRHARLAAEIPEEELCISAIPGEIRQVLFNLLTNAAHFTPPGKPVSFSLSSRDGYAEIRVRDEGPGISNESRSRLFQPFFTTRGKEGTGIGLWVSKEMVERAGGRITFISDPKTRPGTEFLVTLPLVDSGRS